MPSNADSSADADVPLSQGLQGSQIFDEENLIENVGHLAHSQSVDVFTRVRLRTNLNLELGSTICPNCGTFEVAPIELLDTSVLERVKVV